MDSEDLQVSEQVDQKYSNKFDQNFLTKNDPNKISEQNLSDAMSISKSNKEAISGLDFKMNAKAKSDLSECDSTSKEKVKVINQYLGLRQTVP